MRVLVSGGTGLVGRYIVEGLVQAGHAVVVGGRTAPVRGLFSTSVEFRPMTLDPGPLSADLFEGIDGFVHAAFDHLPGRYRGGEGEDPEGFVRRNLDGTAHLFEQARDAGVRRVVFLSSRAVYDGLAPGTALTEDAVLAPGSLYGRVKLDAERVLEDLTRPGFTGTSLRLTGVYGHLRPNKWDALFSDYLAGRPVAARAGSEVHGQDAADAVRRLLERDELGDGGGVYNCSDVVTDTRELLTLVQMQTGCTAPLPEPADRSAVAEMRTDKLRALGWRPGGLSLLKQTVRALVR